jgi:hypothetical protein
MGLLYLYVTEEFMLLCYTYCYVTSAEQRGTLVCSLLAEVLVYCSDECRLLQFSSVPFLLFFSFIFVDEFCFVASCCAILTRSSFCFESAIYLRYLCCVYVRWFYFEVVLSVCSVQAASICIRIWCRVSVSLNPVSRILDSFAKQFQRASVGFVISVRPYGTVRVSTRRIFMKSCVGDFLELYKHVPFWKSHKIIGIYVFNIHRSVIYSYSTTNKMHLLSQILYSCKTLYMFRSFRPSPGAEKCVYSNRYMSNSSSPIAAAVQRIPCCLRSFELLMMDGKTVRNM